MRLSHWTIGIAVAVATSSVAPSASAQEEGQGTRRFGSPGFIVSADRLLPLISYQSIKTSDNGSSDTQSRLSIALMNSGPFEIFASFYNLPRLSFDWVPVRNLTLGGAAWLYTDLQASNTVSPGGGASKSTMEPAEGHLLGCRPAHRVHHSHGRQAVVLAARAGVE